MATKIDNNVSFITGEMVLTTCARMPLRGIITKNESKVSIAGKKACSKCELEPKLCICNKVDSFFKRAAGVFRRA